MASNNFHGLMEGDLNYLGSLSDPSKCYEQVKLLIDETLDALAEAWVDVGFYTYWSSMRSL